MNEGPSTTHDTGSKREEGVLESFAWAFRAILKRWPLVVALTLLGVGVAFAYTKSLPRIFEATTLLEFDPDVIKPLGNKTDPMVGWSALWDTREYYETQYRIMESDRVLSAVVRDLGLQNDPEFLGYRPSQPVPLTAATSMLRGKMVVEPVKGSRLVYIKVVDTKPAQARRLSEAIARTYIAQNLEAMVSATADTAVWLSGQLEHFKAELEQNENALHEFKRENELPSSTLEDLSKLIRMEMESYDSALTRTRLHRQELAARNAELSKLTEDQPDQIPASELLANAYLANLRKQYQDALRERAELLAEGKGENHPAVKKADQKIGLAKDALVSEVKTIQRAAARDLAIVEQQESGEASLYESSKRRAVDLNMKELEFHRLDRLRAENEKLYSVLLEQLKEADLRRMMNTNNIRLIDLPIEPKDPVSPRVPMNIAVGLLIGLFLGVGLALLREALDNTVKAPEDVEKRLNATFLGLLPTLRKDEHMPKNGPKRSRRSPRDPGGPVELIVHANPTSGIAEAARSLRTNLMFMNPDRPYRRLLVTSAIPSEGKTTVATSVAITLAQSGQRVCIVDCDLRRPRLHRIFDRTGDVGLMNVLVGEATIDEAAKPTTVPNLYCLPCGPIPPSSADVVASEKFRKLLDELGSKFDRIVLDSPPVVSVTDSAILSTIVDGVIVVVRAFSTTVGLSSAGLRALRDVEAPIAGVVLNAVDTSRNQYYYAGYYYYQREGYAPVVERTANDDGRERAAPPPPN